MNKKILLFCIVNCAFCIVAYAQSSQRMHNLREVVVWGKRPMKDIGVQKTTFDSIALKENIALSMADILTFNSSVFVKSYGRATLSTVAFRGTSPSHTQVTWNGMRINNPMLGMTDFSTIPSYFIDQASLLHGTSSVNETGGGLGGLVKLGTIPDVAEGVNLQYVQGVGSFSTFDEFARFTYGSEHWHVSSRVVYSSSPNDYKYINHDKKVNIYDDDKNIIGQYHPTERNRSGAYKDSMRCKRFTITPTRVTVSDSTLGTSIPTASCLCSPPTTATSATSRTVSVNRPSAASSHGIIGAMAGNLQQKGDISTLGWRMTTSVRSLKTTGRP